MSNWYEAPEWAGWTKRPGHNSVQKQLDAHTMLWISVLGRLISEPIPPAYDDYDEEIHLHFNTPELARQAAEAIISSYVPTPPKETE